MIYLQGFSYLTEDGARGLLNIGKYHKSHEIWKSRFGLKKLDLHLNYQIQNHNKYQCNCLDFIIAHGYMHQCVNVNICNFAIFGPIFVKFSLNCGANELGMLFTILGNFC